ncbi:MAG: chemotaxis protein CheA [Desulfobacterales bacterium]|nr:chemotaxis protein CheA [Desulfobacterales bacterium]
MINLQTTLQPLRDELNLKLQVVQPKEEDIPVFGEILRVIEQIDTILNHHELTVFVTANQLIRFCISECLTENVSYEQGLAYVKKINTHIDHGLSMIYEGSELTWDFATTVLELKREIETQIPKSPELKTSDEDSVILSINQDMIETDSNLIVEFINESDEFLCESESCLLELEKDSTRSDLIDKIFRMIHSIKGASGFIGVIAIESLSHQMEDLLAGIRDKKRTIDPLFFNACFKTIDVLRQLFGQLKEIMQGKTPIPVRIGEAEAILQSSLSVQETSRKPEIPKNIWEQSEKIISNIQEIADEIRSTTPSIRQQEVHQKQEIENRKSKIEDIVKSETDILEMVKVPAKKLDELSELIGEMVVALSVLSQNRIIAEIKDREAKERLDQLYKVSEHLRDQILGIRMFPVGNIFSKLSRQVRDLSQKFNKQIELHIEGAETLVDKSIIDRIYTPLMHLVRNAIDHGIESANERLAKGKPAQGHVNLIAEHQGDSIEIEIRDDGKGLDRQAIFNKAVEKELAKSTDVLSDQQVFAFIFQAGLSTAKEVTDVSGRGVGMDVVKREIDHLRGKISITSTPGKGTAFSIKLPLTTSIIDGLVVRVGHYQFIFPILDVHMVITPKSEYVKGVHGQEGAYFLLAKELVPIIPLYRFFEIKGDITDATKAIIVVIHDESKKYGVMVDELLHRQQIVIKSLGNRFATLQAVTGGTILGDGRVGLILDPSEFIRHYRLVQDTNR